jgi:hypothetical protein
VRTSTLASRFIGVTPLRPDPALDGRATSFCPLYPVTLRRYAPLPV